MAGPREQTSAPGLHQLVQPGIVSKVTEFELG